MGQVQSVLKIKETGWSVRGVAVGGEEKKNQERILQFWL